MTAPDTDHAAAIRDATENIDPTAAYVIDTHAAALQRERDDAREELAASEARCGRYRIALESEFAYNMLAIVQQYADPKRTTNAAEAALAAWQELRRHNDPISLWPGYQPGDLADKGEVTT